MSEPRAIYRFRPRQHVRRGERDQPSPGDEAGFPGCRARPMNAVQLAHVEEGQRFEYWDAKGGVAWMVREPASAVHERPVHRLVALLERIAEARGAAIECCGATTFYERGLAGEHIRAMEADQTVYLDASRGQALCSPALVLGDEAPPDIVLEVDHTTDVRRRKIHEYQRWRFPEVWVEVPEAPHRSRSRRRSGVTIHLLDAKSGRYREAAASRGLPGWTAAEIHRALNEPARSAGTWAALGRVGRALGQLQDAGRSDAPAQRSDFLETRAAASLRVANAAYAKGTAATARAVRQILAHRGIVCSAGFLADADAHRLAAHTPAQLVDAAFACRSEEDFLAARQS